MNIIPVMDLKAGAVVRAVGGQRDAYEPVQSELFPSSDPAAVARVLKDRLRSDRVYVADLDAINGSEPDWNALQAIADVGLRLMLDAGVGELPKAVSLAEASFGGHQVDWVIVALESLEDVNELAAIVKAIGSDRAVFSLDLFNGRPIGRKVSLQLCTPVELADLAWNAGFRRLVALDLATVGRGQGPATVDVCRQLAARHQWHELISGGGVRDDGDLLALSHVGCHAVLVASALQQWAN